MKRHFFYLVSLIVLLGSCQKSTVPQPTYLDAEAKAKLASKVQTDPLLAQLAEASFNSTNLMREGRKAPTFNMDEYAAQTKKNTEMRQNGQLTKESYAEMQTRILTASGFGNVDAYVTALEKERSIHQQLHAKYPGLQQFDSKEWVQLIDPIMAKVYKSHGLTWYSKPTNTSL